MRVLSAIGVLFNVAVAAFAELPPSVPSPPAVPIRASAALDDHSQDAIHNASFALSMDALLARDIPLAYASQVPHNIPWGDDGNPNPILGEARNMKRICIADDTEPDTKGCQALPQRACDQHNKFLPGWKEDPHDPLNKCEWVGGDEGCVPVTYTSCKNAFREPLLVGQFEKIVFFSEFQKPGEREKEMANYDKVTVVWSGHGPDGLGMYKLVSWLAAAPGAFELVVESIGCAPLSLRKELKHLFTFSALMKKRFSEPEATRLKGLTVRGNQMHIPWGSRISGFKWSDIHATLAEFKIHLDGRNLVAEDSDFYTCRYSDGERSFCMEEDKTKRLVAECHDRNQPAMRGVATAAEHCETAKIPDLWYQLYKK